MSGEAHKFLRLACIPVSAPRRTGIISFSGRFFAFVLHTVEADAVAAENEVYLAQRAVSVFGNTKFGGNLLSPRGLVPFLAVQKHDDVRILFNRA